MLSTRPLMTSRKRRFSTLSRRSVSASMIGTPALASCSRWKQKLIRSWRRPIAPLNRLARLLRRRADDEVEPHALQAQLQVEQVDGLDLRPISDLPRASIAL